MCSQDRLEQKHFQHACILLICKNNYQRFRKMKTTWSTPFPVLEALAEWSERIFGQISESKECQMKPTFVAAQHSNVKNRTNRKEVRTTENTLRKYNSHEISNAHFKKNQWKTENSPKCTEGSETFPLIATPWHCKLGSPPTPQHWYPSTFVLIG